MGEGVAREDSDVVGNVLVKRGDNEAFAVVRFGGDGPGQSLGRHRFAFNTVLVAPGAGAAVFRLVSRLEGVEMHSNIFAMRSGGAVNLLREVEAEWTSGRAVAGTNNWGPTGSTNVPPEWTGMLLGADPDLLAMYDLAALDFALEVGSPAIDSGLVPPVFTAHPFSMPLEVPGSSPVQGVGSIVRPIVGTIDRGAYEFGSGSPPFDASVPAVTDAAVTPGTDAGPAFEAGAAPGLDSGPPSDGAVVPGADAAMRVDSGSAPAAGGCGCRAQGPRVPAPWLASGLGCLLLVRRRARRGSPRLEHHLAGPAIDREHGPEEGRDRLGQSGVSLGQALVGGEDEGDALAERAMSEPNPWRVDGNAAPPLRDLLSRAARARPPAAERAAIEQGLAPLLGPPQPPAPATPRVPAPRPWGWIVAGGLAGALLIASIPWWSPSAQPVRPAAAPRAAAPAPPREPAPALVADPTASLPPSEPVTEPEGGVGAPPVRSARRAPARGAADEEQQVEPVTAPERPTELELLRAARASLASDPLAAAHTLETHAELYPRGVFAQEREALWVEALARTGRRTEARRRADALFAAEPNTAYRARLEELLGP